MESFFTENQLFENYYDTKAYKPAMNHTPTGSGNVSFLNSTKRVGPAKILQVKPGDVVDMKAYVKFTVPFGETTNADSYGDMLISIASAFGGADGGTATEQAIFDTFDGQFATMGAMGDGDAFDEEPRAYLQYLFFDENMLFLRGGYAPMTEEALVPYNANGTLNTSTAHQMLQRKFITETAGYLYIYVANESSMPGVEIFFDDITLDHYTTMVTQTTDYYPFGSVARRASTPNVYFEANGIETDGNDFGKYYKYGYQGQFALEDAETNWNSFELRMYDAVIGRWMTTDPMKQYASPYLSMGNNPVMRVDPDGGEDWIPQVDENGNTYYVAEAGDNIQTFMEQFNVSYDDALKYFGNSGYSGAEGPFSLASIKEGTIINAPFLQYNLSMTDGGWFAFDYWSKETQQRSIDHFGFALKYARANGFESFKVGDIYNFNKMDFSGQTGFIFKGNMIMNGKHVPVTLDVVTMWNSVINTSPTPKGVHNDQFINYRFYHPNGTYKGHVQIPAKYYDTANDYFFK